MVQKFPFFLTECAAVTMELKDFLLAGIENGLGPSQAKSMIQTFYTQRFTRLQSQYYAIVEKGKPSGSVVNPFGSFNDERGYYGKVPSVKYLASIIIKHVQKFQVFYDFEVQRRYGTLYKMDHCFKPAKHLYQIDGQGIFNSLLTCMNEYGEIRINSFTTGTTNEETQASLRAMKQTLEANYQPFPKHFYSDICCKDRPMLENTFESLGTFMDCSQNLPIPNLIYICLDQKNDNDVNSVLFEAVQYLESLPLNEFLAISIDCEWKVTYSTTKRVDTIQLAYLLNQHERLIVIQIKTETLPKVLQMLLCSEKIQWIGNYVSSDINRINEVYFINTPKKMQTNCINLNATEKVKHDFGTSRVSLSNMCTKYLGYSLPKDLRMSDWSGKLTKFQIDYAARDAWCGLLIYLKFANKDELDVTGLACPLPLSAGSEEPKTVESITKLQSCRVHLDPIHAMMRITKTISKQHPLFNMFCTNLRDAIFQLNPDDVDLVSKKLQENSLDFETKLKFDPDWVFKRVRRHIGSAAVLEKNLKELRAKFKEKQFTVTIKNKEVSLLNSESLAALDELIENHLGCLSDPDDVTLYYKEGKDQYGLQLYHCVRGTNSVESYHQWLERMFTSWCQGPELSDAVFTILRHARNVSASEKHRPNFPKLGHTSHWLLDQIQRSTAQIFGKAYYSWWRQDLQGKNVTNESFGIVPSFEVLINEFDQSEFDSKSPGLEYICRKMKSTCPYLPIITPQEKRLFRDNIVNYFVGRKKNSFDFQKMADDWNQGKLKRSTDAIPVVPSFKLRIFKKSANHIERFFKIYQKLANTIAAQKFVATSIDDFQHFLRNSSNNSFYIPESIAVPLDADITLLDIDDESEWNICTTGNTQQLQEEVECSILYSSTVSDLAIASTSTQSPMLPVATIQQSTSVPLPIMAPSCIRTATFDFNRNLNQTTIGDKRKLTNSERTQRKCAVCGDFDCPGIIIFTIGKFRRNNCNYKKVRLLRPISIAPNSLNVPTTNQLKNSPVIDETNDIVSVQNSLHPSLASKTDYLLLNGCLHGLYGNEQDIVAKDRTCHDLQYLSHIRNQFNENGQFVIGFWIDKMKRALQK